MTKQVIVKGITLKGKNRIKEHGVIWDVVDESDRLLLCSTVTKYLKWGPDPDFEIVMESDNANR